MTSEKNPNLISFPSFSAITSSGKKKTTHQKSTYSPPRLKGSEIKRQMKFIHVGFIFWGSACWQRSGRNMLPGQLSLKFCCRYEMLKLSKILVSIIFYCSSEITVRYITRRFCRSKIEPQGKWENRKKAFCLQNVFLWSLIHASAFPQSPLSSIISSPPRILHGIGVWFLIEEEKPHCSTSSSTELCQSGTYFGRVFRVSSYLTNKRWWKIWIIKKTQIIIWEN